MSLPVAVVVVRGGELPDGGDEAVAEAGGRALLVGEGARAAADALAGVASDIRCWERPGYAPAAWAAGIAPLVAGAPAVILPASPDGRDLAPRLARVLNRPLLAGAVQVGPHGARVSRRGGLVLEDVEVTGPFVATLAVGVRGVDRDPSAAPPAVSDVDGGPGGDAAVGRLPADARTVTVLPADPATVDLSEATRIVAGGAGLGSAEAFDLLTHVGLAVGASMGGTRVVADWGWILFERQIGTTGVTVHPRLYVAFGISGAVQHVAGLGQPDHVVSVNVDPSCPMMGMADLAVLADAPATLRALAARLGVMSHA